MSMSKLISEVIEVFSVNRCYRQNILQNFCNFKNDVSVKDLYTKVEEMLTKFEKKNMMLNIFVQLNSALLLTKVKNILNY